VTMPRKTADHQNTRDYIPIISHEYTSPLKEMLRNLGSGGLSKLRRLSLCQSENFNLAFFIAKRMEFVTKQARLILPYGMLLTRLFKYVMGESPELFNESYAMYDHVMYPLTAQQERKTRKDYGTKRGRHSTFYSSAFGQPSSSNLNDDDDDDGNDEGTLG
ncbi:hypothetical protein Tco_0116544, partial [Tanacetum coccineum]